jgi:hypothetical protein
MHAGMHGAWVQSHVRACFMHLWRTASRAVVFRRPVDMPDELPASVLCVSMLYALPQKYCIARWKTWRWR